MIHEIEREKNRFARHLHRFPHDDDHDDEALHPRVVFSANPVSIFPLVRPS